MTRGRFRVDLDYGRPGTLNPTIRDDGYGTSHLVYQHADDLHAAPITLTRGAWYPHEEPEKVYVVHKDHIAILKQRQRTDGSFSQTRYGVTTHFKDAKAAFRVKQKTALLEGR